MRVLLNYMHKHEGICLSFCDSTATRGLGVRRTVKDRETFLRIVSKMRGAVEEVERGFRHWGQGSTWVHLSGAQCWYFGIPFDNSAER